MSPNTLLLLQSILSMLQVANAGIAMNAKGPDAWIIMLVVGSTIGGLQYYVQHVGNQTNPNPPAPPAPPPTK